MKIYAKILTGKLLKYLAASHILPTHNRQSRLCASS
jgi:hypothetical protein